MSKRTLRRRVCPLRIYETGGANVVELAFLSGEIIRYDGRDWHHIKP